MTAALRIIREAFAIACELAAVGLFVWSLYRAARRRP